MKLDPPPQPPRPEITSFREFREHLRGDYAVNGRSIWTPGFQAMATYRLGIYCPNIPTKVLRSLGFSFYQRMRFFVRNFYGIELYPRTRIGRRLRIAHQHGIVIHPEAVIGDDCLIRQGVTIGALRKGHKVPVLGDRVQVGAGAVIVGTVRVGDDAIIGPNAVVMTNVPPGGIVASPQCRIVTPPPRKADVAAPPREADVADTKPAGDMANVDRQETLQ